MFFKNIFNTNYINIECDCCKENILSKEVDTCNKNHNICKSCKKRMNRNDCLLCNPHNNDNLNNNYYFGFNINKICINIIFFVFSIVHWYLFCIFFCGIFR